MYFLVMDTVEIVIQIQKGDYRFSDHVVKRMIERNISRKEIEQSI